MIHFQGKRRRFVSKIICNEIMRNKISSSRNLVNIRRVDLIISIVDIKKTSNHILRLLFTSIYTNFVLLHKSVENMFWLQTQGDTFERVQVLLRRASAIAYLQFKPLVKLTLTIESEIFLKSCILG